MVIVSLRDAIRFSRSPGTLFPAIFRCRFASLRLCVKSICPSGAGFQPAISGKQGWKNPSQLPGGN
jgi:hypothetical protein